MRYLFIVGGAIAAITSWSGACAETSAPEEASWRIDLWGDAVPRIEQVETLDVPRGSLLSSGILRDGWKFQRSWVYELDEDSVWATSLVSSLDLTVLRPRDLVLFLRLRQNPEAAKALQPQRVDVTWRTARVGVCEFGTATEPGGAHEFSLSIPKEAQRVGKNQVVFHSRFAVSDDFVAGQSKPSSRPRAFGLCEVRLSEPGTAPAVAMKAVSAVVGSGIVQTAGTRLSYPVLLPPEGQCRFHVTPPSIEGADLRLCADGLSGRRDETVIPLAGPVELDLSPHVGRVVEIIFDTTRCAPGAEIVWQEAAVVADHAFPTFEWCPLPAGLDGVHREDLNVVFIILDALRADSVGCYGYGRDTTPAIDRLAAEGVVFERAYAAAPYTYSSTWSLVTSAYPYQHGAPMVPAKAPTELVRLQDCLGAAGIHTGCVSANSFVTDKRGNAEGFAEMLTTFENLRENPRGDPTMVTRAATRFIKRAVRNGQRFFLYAHYRQPHFPYVAPEAFEGLFALDPEPVELSNPRQLYGEMIREEMYRMKTHYDENIRAADTEVGEICKIIQELSIGERTVVIVTSDHGEAFNEHGFQGHNSTVYNDMTRIPLVISGGPTPRGLRYDRIVRNIDFYPTICDLLGVVVPGTVLGRSLLRAVEEPLPQGILAFSQPDYTANPLEAYWWDRYKLIRDAWGSSIEVYDLEHDPAETANIAAHRPVLTDYLLAQALAYRQFLLGGREIEARTSDNVGEDLNPSERDQLNALGYLE